jgi:hypothetical protein
LTKAITSLEELYDALIQTSSSAEVRRILESIGDEAAVAPDEPFGPLGLVWHPYGDTTSNISTIGLATKPGRSLGERLTNAMDALLEDRAVLGVPLPTSARQAAQDWFGRPVTGPDDGLFKWNFSEGAIDRRIYVILSASEEEESPTVDVFDMGVGISGSEFSGTILSLQGGNKMRKWYVIGAFGQGGASTLGFSQYVLIASRSNADTSHLSFTLIRVLRLDRTWREDLYAYLAVPGPNGTHSVPTIPSSANGIAAFSPIEGVKLPLVEHGTLVRHYGYRLPNLSGSLIHAPGNLYHYLHASLFDPLFPFRLVDLRNPARFRDELVTGSRNRLMRLVAQKAASESREDDARIELRHHRPMEYVVPVGSTDPSIGIEYWVVLHYRKPPKGAGDELILRPYSSEAYVHPGHPIVGTLNGQTQGEMTARFIADCGLGLVSRHIVVHIDATRADNQVRRELFATTREGFKEGPVLSGLLQVLKKMLEEDTTLHDLEHELTEKLARRETRTTNDEVKRHVTRLLLDAGYRPKLEGSSFKPGGSTDVSIRPSRTSRPMRFDPLPTLPYPQVTKFEIVTPRPKMLIAQNDVEVVLVETDADGEFDRRDKVKVRTDPDSLEVAAKSALRGGRIRWRMRPKQDTQIGEKGNVIATLTLPDGKQLTDQIDFEVLPPHVDKVMEARGEVPPFDILPVDPDQDPQLWQMIWPDVAANDLVDRASVAYRPVMLEGVVKVYYSTVFPPFAECTTKLKAKTQALAELFRTHYEIWIGYHGILQHMGRKTDPPTTDEPALDKILEVDRARVANMQVKQALSTAELQYKYLREPGASVKAD